MPDNTLFLDCDGVLAAFDALATTILGMPPQLFEDTYGTTAFWQRLRDYEDFYYQLDLMPDAMALWNGTKHLHPVILTGCPVGGWAEGQKRRWAHKMFGEVMIITTMARQKCEHITQPGDILIDDRLTYRQHWEEAGGIFVHHVSAQASLAALRTLKPAWFVEH